MMLGLVACGVGISKLSESMQKGIRRFSAVQYGSCYYSAYSEYDKARLYISSGFITPYDSSSQ